MRTLLLVLAGLVCLSGVRLATAQSWDISDLKVAKAEDKVDVKVVPPPKGAVVLFDGKDLDAWAKADDGKSKPTWKLVKGDAVQVHGGNIVTRRKFDRHFKLHVEFRVPYMPDKKSQERGNSGVYVQGRYEVQVLDSYQNETYEKGECGAIYEVSAPSVNACKAPTIWQSYDIEFRAPGCEDGKKTEPARITVYQNGVKIQDNVKITTDNTRAGLGGDVCQPGPIMLQDHGAPVQYRNIWLLPLES
jgi:hypothetical protein